MNDSLRCIVRLSALLFVLFLDLGRTHAQPPFYRIGAPYPPVRDPRLTTDNGIPGTGSYYYRDYPYPSLREALQQYGFFGRRLRARERSSPPLPDDRGSVGRAGLVRPL